MSGFLLSCGLFQRPGAMADYMPRETDVPGWVLADRFSVSNARKIIHAVPLSSEYGPQEMVGAAYTHISDTTKSVTVRVIRFRNHLDAFGLYGRERGLEPGAQFTDDDTYARGNGLFSRQGKFYVSVTGGQDGDPAVPRQFLAVVRQNLKSQSGTDRLPDYILALSDRGSSRDIIYYPAGLEAIPGSRELFVTRRSLSGKSYDLVYSRLPNAFDAEQMFHRILKAGGGAFMLTRIGSLQPAIKAVAGNEYLFVSCYKQWIFGALNAENMSEVNRIIVYLYGDIRVRAEKSVSSAAPEQ